MTQLGHIKPGVGKPCQRCAAQHRLTWLNTDGTCRRCDGLPEPQHVLTAWNCREPYDGMTYADRTCHAC